jgi:YHS domain-containing protein
VSYVTALENTFAHSPKIIDPVCGMEVEPGRTKLVSVYNGHSFWFCAEGCRRAFEADPEKVLKPTKKKGWLGRYLERMAKINAKEFGDKGAKCH